MRPREPTQVSNGRHRERRTPSGRSRRVHESQGCFARARKQPPWPRRSFSSRSSHRLPRVHEVPRSVSGRMAPEDGHSCPSGFRMEERTGKSAHPPTETRSVIGHWLLMTCQQSTFNSQRPMTNHQFTCSSRHTPSPTAPESSSRMPTGRRLLRSAWTWASPRRALPASRSGSGPVIRPCDTPATGRRT